jgi:hypothetical protein
MTTRDRLLIMIVVAIVAVAGSWILVIQPKRDEASKLAGQVTAAQTQLGSARAQIAAAELARSTYASNYAAVAKLGEALPADDNTGSLIFQLQDAATRAGVDFRSLVLNPASSGPAAATPSTSSTSQAVTATLPPGAAVGAAGLPTLPFTFTFTGNFFHLANFFGRMERFVVATNNKISVSGRLMTLNAISLGAGPRGFPQIIATISATTYLVPASEGLTAGALPSGPAASASAHPVSGSTSVPPAATITPVP